MEIKVRDSAGIFQNVVVPPASGGTGQTTLAGARNAMGLGNTTGPLPVANGGTSRNTVSGYCSLLFPTYKLPIYLAGFGAGYKDGAYVTPADLMGTYIKMGIGAAPATQTAGSIYIQYTQELKWVEAQFKRGMVAKQAQLLNLELMQDCNQNYLGQICIQQIYLYVGR